MSDSLIPSFLVSNVSESLRSLTKNERMSELLIFMSDSLGKPMSQFPALSLVGLWMIRVYVRRMVYGIGIDGPYGRYRWSIG